MTLEKKCVVFKIQELYNIDIRRFICNLIVSYRDLTCNETPSTGFRFTFSNSVFTNTILKVLL